MSNYRAEAVRDTQVLGVALRRWLWQRAPQTRPAHAPLDGVADSATVEVQVCRSEQRFDRAAIRPVRVCSVCVTARVCICDVRVTLSLDASASHGVATTAVVVSAIACCCRRC